MFAAIGISHRKKYITKMVVKKKDGGRSSGDGEKRGSTVPPSGALKLPNELPFVFL